jgi:acetoin utilization protein AcuB
MQGGSFMVVQEIMTSNPVAVDATDSLERVEALLRELDARHLPVLDAGSLVGIISDRDLGPLRAEIDGESRGEISAGQIMSSDLITVTEETELSEVVDTLLAQRVGALPVVADDGRTLVGIVSYVDVLRAVREEL